MQPIAGNIVLYGTLVRNKPGQNEIKAAAERMKGKE
jgi:hypothetical protein